MLLNEVTNSNIRIEENEEVVDMCQGIQELISEGRQEGRQHGMYEGRQDGMEALVHTLKRFLHTPEEIYNEIIRNSKYADVTLSDVMRYYE